MRDEQRRRVEDVVLNMVEHRHWTGGGGFDVTDEMRVTISGQAALMTLGLDQPYYFHRVPDIIVYPKPFFVSQEQAGAWSTDPIFGGSVDSPRLGEAWHRGPIVLAWSSIVEPLDDHGSHLNVVIHEFTHHLDGLDGDMSGTPPMTDRELEREWYRVTELDYLELVGRADRDEPALLSHYGAADRAEFFAVATECFFDRPHDLRDQHPHLYQVLSKYFRQSPANYLPRAAQPPQQKRGKRSRPRSTRGKYRHAVEVDPFTRGLSELNDGDLHAACRSLTAAIEADAGDSEAYAARAHAYFELSELASANADAEMALSMDPEDYEAMCIRGCVRVQRGDLQEGVADLREVCLKDDSSLARSHLGHAYLRQGKAKRAIHELSLAIGLDPAEAGNYRWRAEAYHQLGDAASAERDEEKARRVDPQS